MITETKSVASVAFADQQPPVDIAAAIGFDIGLNYCGEWLAQHPNVCRASRYLLGNTTPLFAAPDRLHAKWEQLDAVCHGLTLDERIGVLASQFQILVDEGSHLADCGIHDRGLDEVPECLDWQCFIAETYVRGKTRTAGVPAYVGTLAAGVICGALRDRAWEQFYAAQDPARSYH